MVIKIEDVHGDVRVRAWAPAALTNQAPPLALHRAIKGTRNKTEKMYSVAHLVKKSSPSIPRLSLGCEYGPGGRHSSAVLVEVGASPSLAGQAVREV